MEFNSEVSTRIPSPHSFNGERVRVRVRVRGSLASGAYRRPSCN
jgi:hypothetical protein